MTRKLLIPAIFLAVAVLTGGCIEKETEHSIYLAPDGGVTWSVLERDVRSSETDPGKRRAEEAAVVDRAERGMTDVAQALDELGGVARVRILRAERPWSFLTEASFPAVDRVAQKLLDRLGIDGRAELRADGARRELVLRWREPDSSDDGDLDEVVALLDGDVRIVLTSGRFVAARGFDLEGGATAAVPAKCDLESLRTDDGEYEASLAWEVE